MRGELDWVVMRCLEKDRSRRYDTASNLVRDVERYLKDEPVEARPPTVGYRMRKFARRHRTGLFEVGVCAAIALVGFAVSIWQASLARADRERAELAEAKQIQDKLDADAALLAERRQYALDKAIEAAFGGDLKKAHTAILAAEAVGVAPDRVHWLHGLVHYQQGRLEDAIKEFQSSIDLKPSVAAHAMHARALFAASLHSGHWVNSSILSELNDLNAMTPETAEDYLCRGFAVGPLNRRETLADFEKAIAMRDTPMAHAFRASAVSRIAFDESNHSLAERSLDYIRQAKLRLSDNKFVRHISLSVHLNAADMYDETGQSQNQKDALDEAGRDAQVLEGIPSLDYVMARVYYFEHVGDGKAALAELDRASRRPETSDLVAQYALALYERGRDDQALSVLDERLTPTNPAGQMLQIILWAGRADVGPCEAYERYRKWAAKREADGQKPSQYEAMVLLLLGNQKEAADTAELRVNFPKVADNSRILRCQEHYLAGLSQLSDGDRAGAREHFQKALDTKFFATNAYPYARAFLARMKRNPEWPKWITVKK